MTFTVVITVIVQFAGLFKIVAFARHGSKGTGQQQQ